MVVLLEIHSVRTRWWFRKDTNGHITVSNELFYEIDLDGFYDPNKVRYVLTRDGAKISRHDLKAHHWEILRDGTPIATVDERYGTYGGGYYDLFWEGTVYKSFRGMRSLSDAPSLQLSDFWSAPGNYISSPLFGKVRVARYAYRDDLDPDIAAILALHEYAWK